MRKDNLTKIVTNCSKNSNRASGLYLQHMFACTFDMCTKLLNDLT